MATDTVPPRCRPRQRRASTTGSCVCGRPMAKRLSSLRACVSSMPRQQAQKSSRTSSSQARSFPFRSTRGHLAESDGTGIGSFTILDDKIADGEDVGVSFFLEETSIGRPRGEEACALIGEMNPDVRGTYINQVPSYPESLGC